MRDVSSLQSRALEDINEGGFTTALLLMIFATFSNWRGWKLFCAPQPTNPRFREDTSKGWEGGLNGSFPVLEGLEMYSPLPPPPNLVHPLSQDGGDGVYNFSLNNCRHTAQQQLVMICNLP